MIELFQTPRLAPWHAVGFGLLRNHHTERQLVRFPQIAIGIDQRLIHHVVFVDARHSHAIVRSHRGFGSGNEMLVLEKGNFQPEVVRKRIVGIVVCHGAAQPPRRLAVLLLDPDVADPIRRLPVDAELRQCHAVEGNHVRNTRRPRLNHDRMNRRRFIQHFARWEIAFRQIPVRAANEVMRLTDRCGHDPLAWRRYSRAGRDTRYDIIMRCCILNIDQRFVQRAVVQQMRMRIDQARQYRRALQIDALRIFRSLSCHVLFRSDREDVLPFREKSSGRCSLISLERNDGAVRVESLFFVID